MFHASIPESLVKYEAIGPIGEQRGYGAYVTDDKRLAAVVIPEGWRWRRAHLDPRELMQSGGSDVVARAVEDGFAIVKH